MLQFINRNRKAFSLAEILVACAIIISLSMAAFFSYNSAQQSRRLAQANNDLDAIAAAIVTYEAYNAAGTLPESLEVLQSDPALAATASIDGLAHGNLLSVGKGADVDLVDPWGTAYVYSAEDRTVSCAVKADGETVATIIRRF